MGKASRIQTSLDRLRKQQSQIRNLQATNRNRNTPRPVAATATSGVSAAGDTGGGTGNFLATQGDTMVGPIAVYPNQVLIEIDINGIADISKTTELAYTSYVRIDVTGPSNVLDTLAGAGFDGQLVWLENVGPMTIAQADAGNGGNIVTADGNDIVFTNPQVTPMIFEADLVPTAGVQGGWRVIAGGSTGGGGGGVSFPIRPPIDNRGTVSTNQAFVLSNTTGHVLKFIAAGNFDVTFSAFPTSNIQQEWEVEVTQDATGGRVISFPQVLNPPVLPTTPNNTTIVVFRTNDGGATIRVGNTVTTTSGVTTLSGLTIDVNKDWGAFGISNIGALTGVTGIDLDGATALIQGPQKIDFFQASQQIESLGTGIEYSVGNLQSHLFKSLTDEIAKFEEAASGVFRLDMLDHTVDNAKDYRLDSNASYAIPGSQPGIGFDDVNNRMRINVPTGNQVSFEENSAGFGTGVTINPSSGGSVTANIINALDVLQLGVDVTVPSFEGEFRNDGSDTFVFSGGAVRNMSNIGVAVGANVFLSNLTSPTSINQDLLPQAGKTLGDSGNPWSRLTANKITLGTAGTFSVTDNEIIANAATGMEFNTPTGDLFSFFFNGGTASASISISQMRMISGNFRGNGLSLDNVGFSPIVNGEFRLNGTDVEVFTGGVLKSLTDIGTGGGATELNDLTDVTISTAANDQRLIFDGVGGVWRNQDAEGLETLSFIITSPQAGEFSSAEVWYSSRINASRRINESGPTDDFFSNVSPGVDVVFFIPFIASRDFTFNALAIHAVVATGATNLSIGMYESDPNTLEPTNLIVASNNFVLISSDNVRTTGNITRSPGLYFLAYKQETSPAPGSLKIRAIEPDGIAPVLGFERGESGFDLGNTSIIGYTGNFTTTGMPSTFASTTSETKLTAETFSLFVNGPPEIFIRITSFGL